MVGRAGDGLLDEGRVAQDLELAGWVADDEVLELLQSCVRQVPAA